MTRTKNNRGSPGRAALPCRPVFSRYAAGETLFNFDPVKYRNDTTLA